MKRRRAVFNERRLGRIPPIHAVLLLCRPGGEEANNDKQDLKGVNRRAGDRWRAAPTTA